MKKLIYILLLTTLGFTACNFIDDYINGDDRNKHSDKTDYGETEAIDINTIGGKWYLTQEIDSIILLFENNTFKRYVYQKGTNNILNRYDYGNYSLYKTTYKDGNIEHEMRFFIDTLYSIRKYELKNDTLIFTTRNEHYTKIK